MSDYWKKRMDEILAYVDNTDLDFFNQIQDVYEEARRAIQKELFNFYTKYAEDNKISYQEAKKRLLRDDLSDYQANANKYFEQLDKDEALLKRLNEQYVSGKVTRLEALQLSIDYHLNKLIGNLDRSFDIYLKEVASSVYKKIVGGDSSSTLSPHALEQLIKIPLNGKDFSQRIWNNVDDLSKDLRKILTEGFIKGSSPSDMARELRKKFNVARSRAEAIVRTEGTNVINNTTKERYKALGLTQYEFMAHIDSRTTNICKELNNQVFLLDDYMPGTNAPPMHVNCRSTILPTDEEIGVIDKYVN